MDIREKYRELFNKWKVEKDNNSNKASNSKNKAIGIIITFGIIFLLSIFLFIVNYRLGCLLFVVNLITFFIGMAFTPIGKRKDIDGMMKKSIIQLLSTELNVSVPNIEYELNNVFRGHKELQGHEEIEIYYVGKSKRQRPILVEDWFWNEEKFIVVYDVLGKKFKKNIREEQKADLQVENLKLRNEGLEIDNSMKKTWECAYCGNINMGTEMNCIKCGASRK